MQKKWSQYHLTRELSKKHSHSTYLASPINSQRGHGEPERQVVLTVFASSLFCLPHECENLLQKAQRIKELQHAHLLPILDMGTEKGQPFVVREYLSTGSLRSYLKKLSADRLELGNALTIVSQVGQALVYAHEHNIIHGQVKPENILLDANGQAILTDFSLIDSKDAIIRDQTSEEYAFCYMAPEQFVGTSDARTDQYALGCLAYELITGRVPFATQSLASMMGHRGNAVPALLSEKVANLPPSLDVAVLKTLAQDPEERFFDFSLFLEVIQSVLSPPPAFPLLRSTYSGKNRAASQAVQPGKAGTISSPIRKHTAKRAALQIPEPPRTPSSARADMAEPGGAHLLVDTSLPEPTGSISNPESLASALQSDLFISSLSLDVAPLSNEESAIPDHPLKEHKHNESADFMVGTMSPSKGLTAELAMVTPITEEELDDALLTDPFVEKAEELLVRAPATLLNEPGEAEAKKITSVVVSNTDVPVLRAGRTLRSRRRLLGLGLLLSATLALLGYAFWPFGMFRPDTSSHTINTTSHKLGGTSPQLILVPAQRDNLKASPTAETMSQLATIPPRIILTPAPSPNLKATAIAANPDPYSPYSGTLALNDPLSSNSRGYGWQEFPTNSVGASCQFIGTSYHAFSQKYYTSCHTVLQASNFTFEVQMQIIQGNCGGLSLRDTTSVAHAYNFEVCQDGSYRFNRFDNFSDERTVTSGSSGAIVTGLGQSNVIAAVANGSIFDLYANHQKIASVNDSSYSQGQFGVSAFLNTEAVYTNARMWTL